MFDFTNYSNLDAFYMIDYLAVLAVLDALALLEILDPLAFLDGLGG